MERRWPGPVGNPKLNQDLKETIVEDQIDLSGFEDF